MTETMMCIPLYDDMASVIFGLYENKDEHSPYALFIIGIDDNKIYVFTSEKYIGKKESLPYKVWVKENPDKNFGEIMQRPVLHHEPYVISYLQSGSGQLYDDTFFKDTLGITEMEMLPSIPVCRKSVYVVVYKDKKFKGMLSQSMQSACEMAIFKWRYYFNDQSKDKLLPYVNSNEVIESLPEFREITPFFEIVTKISSLFYEKARSKGSIAVMNSRKDAPLLSFKTGTQAEMLSFSGEYVQQLRKLLETTKNGLSLLVHDNKVYGIDKPDLFRTQYTFNLTGHMEWHILDHQKKEEGIQLLYFKHTKYYFPITGEIQSWYIDSKIKDATVRKLVNLLLSEERIKEFDHGAILIITDKVEEEIERLCGLKRGLRTGQVSMTVHFKEICALCAIDGSLFLDKDGYCHGIGIILDGEAVTEGTLSRGSRYNSTKTYISQCAAMGYEAYALVVSSDGYLDILTTYDFEDIRNSQKIEEISYQ